MVCFRFHRDPRAAGPMGNNMPDGPPPLLWPPPTGDMSQSAALAQLMQFGGFPGQPPFMAPPPQDFHMMNPNANNNPRLHMRPPGNFPHMGDGNQPSSTWERYQSQQQHNQQSSAGGLTPPM